MEFRIGNHGAIVLPPLHITIIAIIIIIIIILLVRWSKQLETKRYRVIFYFLISTYIAPMYSHSTKGGSFELWFPLGFIVVFFSLFRSERNHPSKMKASILGFCLAIYQIILKYAG